MSNSVMINCVPRVFPAKSAGVDTQLVYNQSRVDSILNNTIYKIKNFTNRFMQCGQSTVGTGNPTIQHCILFHMKLAGFLMHLRASKTFSEGIIPVGKNARNNHEYLSEIKKVSKISNVLTDMV